jgi:hypothetical protein
MQYTAFQQSLTEYARSGQSGNRIGQTLFQLAAQMKPGIEKSFEIV